MTCSNLEHVMGVELGWDWDEENEAREPGHGRDTLAARVAGDVFLEGPKKPQSTLRYFGNFGLFLERKKIKYISVDCCVLREKRS